MRGLSARFRNVPVISLTVASCATRLAALGVPGEDVSAILNHVRADVTGRHYDQYARAREKRAALTAWAAELARILDPGQGGEVVSIHAARAR